jgi:4'-phosphopantetheinyl transferase
MMVTGGIWVLTDEGARLPPLRECAVHVWRADLGGVADEICGLLCGQERARGERMVNDRTRDLWMRSRGVLRALLGGYLSRDPSTLRFARGARGKPELSPDAVSFNLSHSGPLALYAVTRTGPVGVDVEVARRPVDEVAITARVLGEAEARRLEELDPASREQAFLRAWVRHEAELKCLGVGIGESGRGGSLGLGNRETDTEGGDGRPWIADLQVGPRAAGAVAMAVAPEELRCWEWPVEAAPGGSAR